MNNLDIRVIMVMLSIGCTLYASETHNHYLQIDCKSANEGLPFITLPSADEIRKKLQAALGAEKCQEYIDRNIDICDHLDRRHLSVPALELAIRSTVLGYSESEKREIKSAVLTTLAKNQPEALKYLREHEYITVQTT